jgi:hypothetical protein
MPWEGLELTIPAFEREKTFHALDRAATAIGRYAARTRKNKILKGVWWQYSGNILRMISWVNYSRMISSGGLSISSASFVDSSIGEALHPWVHTQSGQRISWTAGGQSIAVPEQGNTPPQPAVTQFEGTITWGHIKMWHDNKYRIVH